MARFRPGKRVKNSLALPLHQYLKVQRQKLQADKEMGDKSGIIVGEKDPEKFLDPFMRTLMREPVRLKPSGGIVDRAVALQCVLRDRRDPFTGDRLSDDMLEPLPELTREIMDWRRVKLRNKDVSLSVDDVKSLLDDAAVDPAVLQALVEADRLGHVAKRAQLDARGMPGPAFDLGIDERQLAALTAGPEEDEVLPLPPEFDTENVNPLLSGKSNRSDLIEEGEDGDLGRSKPLMNEDEDDDINVRWRRGDEHSIPRLLDVNREGSCVSMSCPGAGVRPFNFFGVFPGDSSQKQVYEAGPKDLVSAVLNGFNSCLMCYGQTGSGKTHTMFGPEGALETHQWHLHHSLMSSKDPTRGITDASGLVVRACAELLKGKSQLGEKGVRVNLSAQFVEIYNEQLVDLLSGRAVSVRRESGELVGAEDAPLDDMRSVLDILRRGHARKRFAATAMNDRSSRSHTLLIILVTQGRENTDLVIKSELHLADLAGSERVKKTLAVDGRLQEAKRINASLLSLGRVITALTESHNHVPYLDSKLTILLRRALGGNSRTAVMISCRSDDAHGEETLQTLRFGERCGMISNSTKLAAASLSSAIEAIDTALKRVNGQLQSLENRGKQNLESYKTLRSSYLQLQRKRQDLAGSSGMGDNRF
eukprot:CAMPEP_0182422368 /NCGR_PEP_ID=MMETSP1167-20130531/8037_1 /TAXON_ID=2988 /ORGANISM="Mallomonas Sp, Strain CCMP3275" /LENGTH=647 /DNA_ID=CAMNT_0024600377 /DNA_START=372 /DNA_END=2315 /DNA_ORIENTATION=+